MPYAQYLGLVAVSIGLLYLLVHGVWRRLILAAWLGAMVLTVVFLTITSTGRGTPFGDFDKAYYPAGIAARVAPSDLYACGNADGLCFVNLPLVAAAFIPLGALSRPAAHIVVVVVSAASVLATIALLARLGRARGAAAFAVATVVLLNGPLHYSMRLGNLTHVVLTALVAAILALRARRHVTAGVLLAVCALIKPPFLIWLPALVIRGRGRAAVAMGATLGAAVLISVALFGLPLHQTWFSQFVAESNARPLGAYNVQSISGALVRLTTSAYLVEWVGVEVSPALRLFQLGLTAACGLIAGLALWYGRGESDDELVAEQTIIIALMLLISPISWTHYYAFLLIPIAAWSAAAWDHGLAQRPLLALGALLVSLPVTLWIPPHPVFGPVVARVLLSHYVAGAALLLFSMAAWQLREHLVPRSKSVRPRWMEIDAQ